MPSNGGSTNPTGTLNGNSAVTPSKKSKIKTSRSPGRQTSPGRSTSARSAASEATPAEVVFRDQPNPYHPPQPPFIWIDHPQEHERLLGPVYVVRLGVGGAEQVEISIDGGVWQNCRLTSGYWWYDWSAIRPGRHTLVARMRTSGGRWFRTPPRPCEFRP